MESSYCLRSRKIERQQCLLSTSKKKKTIASRAGGSLDTNPFDLLPTEILQKILGYLPVHERIRVERVCKRWKDVSTAQVWRDVQVIYIVESTRLNQYRGRLKKFSKFIRMEDDQLYIDADKLEIIQSLLSKAGQCVKKIIFDSCFFPGKAMLSIINAHCHNIESIDLLMIQESAVEEFLKLFEVNQHLRSICSVSYDFGIKITEKLPLRDWKSVNIKIENVIKEWDKGLVAHIKNSPSLEKLFIPCWTPDILAAIPNCKQLETLYIAYFWGLKVREQLMNLPLLKRLTCLKITGVECKADVLIDLLHQCMNLKSLGLYCSFDNLPVILERAVLPLEKLESLRLNLTGCTDEILMSLLKFKHLKLHQSSYRKSITGNGIIRMIMKSECLEELDISKMNVTMKFFKELAENIRERHKILKIVVSTEIYRRAFKICSSPKIRITREKNIFYSYLRHY